MNLHADTGQLSNPFPTVLSSSDDDDGRRSPPPLADPFLDGLRDELFSLVRRIQDPEHHHSLEQLGVVRKEHITLHTADQHEQGERSTADGVGEGADAGGSCEGEEDVVAVVEVTPTVPHCSLATTIGLCIRAKLLAAIPHLKLDVHIRSGTHHTAEAISKQLNDKERCCAALENPHIHDLVATLCKDTALHD